MSSSPNSFRNSFDSNEPRQELDSPFLNEEYLFEEARTAQWRTPVPEFQIESPFLEAFEEGWGAICEPEVEEFEEFLEESFEEEAISAHSEEDEAVFTEAEDDEYRESDFESEAALLQEEVRDNPQIQVEDGKGEPLTDGEYAFHQGNVNEHGRLDANGRAYFGKIDPTQPFVFEVRDRVCAIRAGAFFNPDDPKIEYGGTWFDWTLVRDDKNADKNFWPYYQREMDTARKNVNPHTVEKFLQHEHITRRPIQIAKPYLAKLSKVRIQATPPRVRVGPFVRYTDYERAVIWMETVTPTMVRVRYKKAGGGTELSRYASTVRVGGRNYAAVEIDGLEKNQFYDYTVELAPLPASGSIPVEQGDFKDVFPKLSSSVIASMKDQLAVASLNKTEWLTFRTLRRVYDKKLRFATGSCRWYPGDTKDGKDKKVLGPDMFDGLGEWLQANQKEKEKWPQFLLFVGDQIYADEIGDNHGLMLTFGRFAERIPGPADPAGSVRDKLIDGAWAGRFAHRYEPYQYPSEKFLKTVQNGLQKLDDIHERYPDIKGIYREYPEADPREKLKWRHRTLKNRRDTTGATGEAPDERKAREAVELLPVVDNLEISVEPFRAFLPHWNASSGLAYRQGPRSNPIGLRYLSHNFLLWSIPDFEHFLPTLAHQGGFTVVRKPDGHGHPSSAEGKHAADFAEYAYLYERSWTSSRNVRVLLAQVPTFLMFDDHELTDDWNFDVAWVRMIHNEKDAYGMWPKTLTDSLAAYWVYQGWCNKAPSQWKRDDPRVKALTDARKAGIDALPELRKCIYKACFTPWPPKNPKAPYQFGISLEWHYRLPFDPPFLVPDCRSRKRLVAADDKLRVIDHDDQANMPMSQTIDDDQIAWMRKILVDQWRGGPVAFLAPSTPVLLQKKIMDFMMKPETGAGAWARGDLVSLGSAATGSTMLGIASDALLRVFRRDNDLEHMIRDKSWRDLWELVEGMRAKGSPVKTLVLVSGDVHHNYCMTANLPGSGRPKPEMLQITCSGLQTPVRSSKRTWIAENLLSYYSVNIGKYRLVPGFMSKNDIGSPDLALFENAVALVDVKIGSEVDVVVTYLAGKDKHVYRYTSGAAYMKGDEPAIMRGPNTETEVGTPWQLLEPNIAGWRAPFLTELELLEDLKESSSHVREHELEQGKKLAVLQETEAFESNEEELDWLTEDLGKVESERAEESVEVELQTPKQGAKKSSLHSVPTTDIFMHVYFKKLSAGYTRQQFFDWIVDQSPSNMGPNRFDLTSLAINLVSNPSTAVTDFKSSLKAAGSVVVYFGHTVLGTKTTLGLTPYDPGKKKPDITCLELINLLNAAKAKIVVLAGCATSQCVTKIKGDTVVIVTQSGKDRVTNTLEWAPAIKALLDELLAGSTVGDALDAANKSFAKASSTDSFKMINGDSTLKII